MSNYPKSVTSQPAIIVFGVSAIGKPRAGTFKGSDVAAARKAAAKLGFSVIDLTAETGLVLAEKVPAGRIGGARDNIVPFISKDLYAQITASELKSQKNGQTQVSAGLTTTSPEVTGPRLPRSWDDIKAGDLVLAQETDPLDGWWQVTIIEGNGDLFKLRWPGTGRGRPLQKHRATLGLICPSEPNADGKDHSKSDPKQSTGKPVYPAHWSHLTVDQTVLAKEDGPMEQWWEAKIVKVDKDQFTLQWRDYPKLPPIVRPRSSLGLMHPAPKVA